MPPTAWHSQAACLAQTALHGPPVKKERGQRMGFQCKCGTGCKPPVGPPAVLMDLSGQCRVWKGTLPCPVGVLNTISCLFGSHLASRVYSMPLPLTSWEKGGYRGKEKVRVRAKTSLETNCGVHEFVKCVVIHNMMIAKIIANSGNQLIMDQILVIHTK